MEGRDGRGAIEAGIGGVRRKAVELLRGISIRRPIGRKLSKIRIQRAVFLHHDNNVIDGGVEGGIRLVARESLTA